MERELRNEHSERVKNRGKYKGRANQKGERIEK